MNGNMIIQGDALEELKDMPDRSVNLAILDPPYYNIMQYDWSGKKHTWDNQWDSFDDYLLWIDNILKEVFRVLKDNASLFIFGDDKNIAYVQIVADKYKFSLLNHIIWYKRNNMANRGWRKNRSFAPVTEHILFYGMPESNYERAVGGVADKVYSRIREYLTEEKEKTGLTGDEINKMLGVASVAGGHYFARSQWVFPTKKHYERMQLTFNAYLKGYSVDILSAMDNEEIKDVLRKDYDVLRKDYDVLRKDYEELRKDYEELRKDYEELRRPFHIVKNYTDVWDIPLIGGKENLKHPTQKPMRLISRIVRSTTNVDDVVLDPFCGSGTTAEVCAREQRKYICIEKEKEYVEMTKKRVEKLEKNTRLDSWGL